MRHLWTPRDPGGDRMHADLKVDPIPRECVAGAKIPFLKGARAEFVWLTITMAVLLRPESSSFLWTETDHSVRRLPTDDWWYEQTEDMVNVHGMTRECTDAERKSARHYAKFFLVPKKDRWGRAIFNCRQANRACRTPPSVNLPRVENLLEKIHEITAGKGLHAFEMDFRCWFYQIPIIGELARHFVISCKEKFYMATGCPMGWSWSPFLAQSVTWGMLLKDIPSHLGARIPDSMESPPAWVEICEKGVCVGIVTAWYDNVLVISSSEKMRNHWCDWIMGKAWLSTEADQEGNETVGGRCKHYNVRVKVAEKTETPIFLGLDFFFNHEKGIVEWKHTKDAGKDVEILGEGATRRQMASTIGFIMWDNMVRLHDTNRVGWALGILSAKTQGVKSRAQWDASANLDLETCNLLNGTKAKTTSSTEDVWMRVNTEKKRKSRIVVASDASSTLLAWMVMGRSIDLCSKPVIVAARVIGHKNIFLKELEAATLAVEGISGTGFCGEIVLLCDNAAAVLAIRKGYSSVPGANELLARIWKALTESGEALSVLRVPGKDNVADSPTRGALLEPRRLDASWEVVRAHDAGEGAPGVTRTAGGRARLGDFIAFAKGERKRVRQEAPPVPEGESDDEPVDEMDEESDAEDHAHNVGDECCSSPGLRTVI